MNRFLLSLSMLAMTGTTQAASPPVNVLLFTADDLHAESLGTYGGTVKDLTPNLDRFAKQGLQFNRAHVNAPICAPSRAIICTGLYGHNSGAMGFMPTREGIPHLVEHFQKAGYLAGVLGKVPHSTPVPGTEWDYSFRRSELGNGRSPSIYYQRTKTFLDRCKSEKKPFYFMVNSHDPHRPYCNPDKLLKGAEMPSRVYRAEDVEVPGFVPDLPGVRAELAMYQNSTRRLDDTFGKVMQALDESGYADSTLVLFMSDNGIAIPFAKCNVWFHASRTPFLTRLPGTIKAGTVDNDHFVSTVDLMPTFLELVGIAGPNKQDGRSIVTLLKGGIQSGRDIVYTQIDKKSSGDAVPMRCVQTAKYGYIYNPFSDNKHRYRNANEGGTMKAMNKAAETNPAIAKRVQLFRYRVPEEFYDLEKDPNCLNNLIGNPEYTAVMQKLQAKLETWMKQTNDPLLPALRNRNNREKVDATLHKTYGKPKAKKKKQKQ